MIIIKYHSLKMLQTLDLSYLFEVLVAEYGADISISFQLMNIKERKKCEELVTPMKIKSITERFWVLEVDGESMKRKHALEKRIVEFGRK